MIPPVLYKAIKTSDYFDERSYGRHGGSDYINRRRDRRVVACDDGVVTKIDFGFRARYGSMCGHTLEIKLVNGAVMKLCHLRSHSVYVGMKVHKGMEIAVYGNTGTLSFGSHCHVQFKINGVLINPDIYINEPAIRAPISSPPKQEYMYTFEKSIRLAYPMILGRTILDREYEELMKSSRDQAAFDRHTKGMWKSPERRQRIEQRYSQLVRKQNEYKKIYVDFQMSHTSPFDRIMFDLADNRAKYRKKK